LTECSDYYGNDAYQNFFINITEFCDELTFGQVGGVSAQMQIFCNVSPPAPQYVSIEFYLENILQAEYRIAFEDFDCSATSWVLDYYDSDDSGVRCITFPSTITLSQSECTPETPPATCFCGDKTDFSPRVEIRGITDGSCGDCACFADFDMCFTPTGDDADCTWRYDFPTFGGDPTSCVSAASYALFEVAVDPNPGYVVVSIYDASDNLLARFGTTYIGSGFACDSSAFDIPYINGSDTCDWSTATATLDMNGAACGDCVPCAPDDATSPDNWVVDLVYDGEDYKFCMTTAVGDCGLQSDAVSGFTGPALYAKLLFGQVARVLIYRDSDDTLIGVYNFLADISTFACDGSTNTMNLATGNAGQCGEAIDVASYTENLSEAAYVSHEACCDGAGIPDDLTATFKDFTSTCCDTNDTGTLTLTGGDWVGSITTCSSGETINISLTQTGTACADLRITVDYQNGCDPGVTNVAPYSCTCGLAKFKVTGNIGGGDDEIWVSW
jgi:hypothetical protein